MTQRGKHAPVDVLAGFNTNEGSYFALYSIPGFSINSSSAITKYGDAVVKYVSEDKYGVACQRHWTSGTACMV